ncbi:hypothetical protein TUM4438_45590 [Shewanella sairae]|uniref:Uncharacterized protein n=1 Tax=Shewanella sairae TaxID=190310 RepID=A0ABQ4PRT5_9GAMM|nr:hypothetical protein [Shewanella sairae]MCL1132632.1 hypothetical protein [Shewanella sairae]GIU52560.1 hypothetical protein TUM4438_45590 [Shewanella sairae]
MVTELLALEFKSKRTLTALLVLSAINTGCSPEQSPSISTSPAVNTFTAAKPTASATTGNNQTLAHDASKQRQIQASNETTKAKSTSTARIDSWENKDEDSDGIPDEQDDYPFDANKSTLFSINETANNNLIETADDVGQHFPFRVTGKLPHSGDTDVFKITLPRSHLKATDRLSITILSSDSNFYPTANLFDRNGTQLKTYREDKIKPVNGLKYHFTYMPNGNETAYLSISSLRQLGDASYTAEISIDNDADGIADIKEKALGMNHHRQDTDSDGIKDSYEYFVYKHNQLETDIDNDGIA